MPDETGPREEDFQALDVPVAQKIAARRAFEEERRNRILNAKKRTIGIEVDVLDEMVYFFLNLPVLNLLNLLLVLNLLNLFLVLHFLMAGPATEQTLINF